MENQKHESEELEFKIDDDVIARIIFDRGYKKGHRDDEIFISQGVYPSRHIL